MHSILCYAGIFQYLDVVLYSAIFNDTPIEFAKSMYRLNIISNESYNTLIKLNLLKHSHKANILTNLLMEDISDPKTYGIFKNNLKNTHSYKKLYHQIDYIG